MVRYLDDSARLNSLLAEIKKSEPVLMLLKKNQCFNCHSVKSKLAGPSFESIIGRYRSNPSNLSYLANKIVQGSKGVWGDSQQMPSHPDIKEGEAKAIAQWIDRNASEPGFDYLPGLEGTLRLPAPFQKNNKGVYVLLASYTDHGIDGKNGKTANQVLVLHPLR